MNPNTFIHTFVPGTTPNSPVLLLLHGTGGDENSLIELGQELLPQAHLLSPRGHILEHSMPRFFKRLSEGVFDIESMQKETKALTDFIASSLMEYALTTNPLYAVGYSNGANIAVNLLLNYSNVLQGAVLMRALLPQQPQHAIELHNLPILLLAGEMDTMISRDATLQLQNTLLQAGAQLDVHWQPTGHQLNLSDVLSAKQWLEKQLAALL